MSGAITVVPRGARPVPVASGVGLTHRGLVRTANEDAILTDPAGQLWAVADGMGGYQNGAMAADIVIGCLETIEDDADPAGALRRQLSDANRRVLGQAAALGRVPMGATVVAVFIARAVAHVAWAGDSRAYLLRGGRLRLITRDHTVVQDLVDRGELRAEDAENHPESHIVTRAVGGAPEIEVDQLEVPLISGDRVMLCSDGLPRCVYESAMELALRGAKDADAACTELVREALENGAPDNVSVIVVDLGEA